MTTGPSDMASSEMFRPPPRVEPASVVPDRHATGSDAPASPMATPLAESDDSGERRQPEPWERAELVGQRLNDDLHAAIGQEPCETACTHLCIPEFSTLTMLGFANSFARAVERHLTASSGDDDD